MAIPVSPCSCGSCGVYDALDAAALEAVRARVHALQLEAGNVAALLAARARRALIRALAFAVPSLLVAFAVPIAVTAGIASSWAALPAALGIVAGFTALWQCAQANARWERHLVAIVEDCDARARQLVVTHNFALAARGTKQQPYALA